MSNNYLSLLNEMFDGQGASLNEEKLKTLIDETLAFFRDIKGKFESEDPKKREEALGQASEMKSALQSKVGDLCEQMGLDPTQLAALFENPVNALSPESLNAIEKVNGQFDQLKKDDRHPHKQQFQFIR